MTEPSINFPKSCSLILPPATKSKLSVLGGISGKGASDIVREAISTLAARMDVTLRKVSVAELLANPNALRLPLMKAEGLSSNDAPGKTSTFLLTNEQFAFIERMAALVGAEKSELFRGVIVQHVEAKAAELARMNVGQLFNQLQ